MPNRVDVDTGDYNPILGFSYGEIAGMSRSMHRSQGVGSPERKGSLRNSLVVIEGEPARNDLLDGVDTTWNRVPGGKPVGEVLAKAAGEFDPEQPEKLVPLLLEARRLLAKLKGPWVELKRQELNQTIALTTGLWLDVTADRYQAAPGATLNVEAMALNRSRVPMELTGFALDHQPWGESESPRPLTYNQPQRLSPVRWKVPEGRAYSQPYWLRQPKAGDLYQIQAPALLGQADTPPELIGRFRIRIEDQEIEYTRPVVYRWVDRLRGERTRRIAVVPPISVSFSESSLVFPSPAARRVGVRLRANIQDAAGRLRLKLPDGWKAAPAARSFQLAAGEEAVLDFEVTPPAGETQATAGAVASVGGREISTGTLVIGYEHIPPQTLSPPAAARLVRVNARTLARSVGYVMGAGDEVPDALRQLGCEVTLLGAADLATSDLSRFDAIVTGIRAYNVRPDLRAHQRRLLDYVKRGGTLIVQYNVLSRRRAPGQPDPLANLGPYPFTVSRDRVTVEEAPMRFLDPGHPVLQTPNRITARDFDGWVQERGLYFASRWNERYQPLWEANDPGERPLAGGTLYTRHGKGAYIFTALAWFRQLPAGVPGAYRIFANFLSAGKAAP